MATYIFFWNPDISSLTEDRFIEEFEYGFEDWSIYEYEKVLPGDEFYMLVCGKINAVIAKGVVVTKAYEGEDWSSKMRSNIYYVDLDTHVCVNPFSADALLTGDELESLMLDFNWHGGHSGRRLPNKYVKKLDSAFRKYIKSNSGMFLNDVAWDNLYGISDECQLTPETAATLIEKAAQLCVSKHAGQRDKMGCAYFLHPMRVAMRCRTNEEKIVALLHDIIEDTDVTPQDLLKKGFPIFIIKAILSITNRPGESYDDFIVRAACNNIGRVVKLNDLEDNLDVLRLNELDDKMAQRCNKYLKARRYLLGE